MNGATGWTDPDGAVHLHGSPVWVFDCSFRRPPSDRPRGKLSNPAQKLLLSNNQPVSVGSVVTTTLSQWPTAKSRMPEWTMRPRKRWQRPLMT